MSRLGARLAIVGGLFAAAVLSARAARADDGDASSWFGGDAAPPPQPAAAPAPAPVADSDPRALTEFVAPLAQHGSWIDHPTYGRVWVPNAEDVSDDFVPYQTDGHWMLDDAGEWSWVSDYDWGYVPFHYGRWIWTDDVGWAWVAGNTYSPAWVDWRVGDDYVGWTPLQPDYLWWNGSAIPFAAGPAAGYCFVRTRHAFARNVGAYRVRTAAEVRFAAATTRPYYPAHPTRAGSGHGGPRAAGPKDGSRRRSPTLDEARVPTSSAFAAYSRFGVHGGGVAGGVAGPVYDRGFLGAPAPAARGALHSALGREGYPQGFQARGVVGGGWGGRVGHGGGAFGRGHATGGGVGAPHGSFSASTSHASHASGGSGSGRGGGGRR